MSVINAMLRDLDRRHAPVSLPIGTSAPPVDTQRSWPRPALALCALAVVLGWGWEHRHAAQPSGEELRSTEAAILKPKTGTPPPPLIRGELSAADSVSNAPNSPSPEKGRAGEGFRSAETANLKPKTLTPPAPLIREELSAADSVSNAPSSPSPEKGSAGEGFAPEIVKQTRPNPETLNSERYDAALAALAQGHAQQAYDLLRDNAPAFAGATDYHAVLAAAEQQLGHYADAAARYRQLLQLDSNQASWWLGLALALDASGNRANASAGFDRALALDTLPPAARDYAASRIAALSTSSKEPSRGR